jgi:GT2 family glycosyltransferase
MTAEIRTVPLNPEVEVLSACWQPDDACWSGDGQSKIVLHTSLPGGRWLAVSGELRVLDGSAELQLCFQTRRGEETMPLPSSLKGSLAEVVSIPAEASCVWIRPLQQSGRFELSSIKCWLLSRWQYQWRLLRRNTLFWLRTPSYQRQQAGIDWRLWLARPAECYRRIGQLRACAPEMDYQEWQQRFETLTVRQEQTVQARLPVLLAKHRLTILILENDSTTAQDWQQSLSSIEQSLGLSAASAASLTCALLAGEVPGEISCSLPYQQWTRAQLQQQLLDYPAEHPVLLLPAGALLAPVALCWWLEAYQKHGATWLYSDHDCLDATGMRITPRFKPDWSLELARSSHYTGDTMLVQADALRQSDWLESESQATVQQLVLQLVELTDVRVEHIPAILWHQATAEQAQLSTSAVQQHLLRLGLSAKVELNSHGYLDIHYPLPKPAPLVSVIIPTKDMLHLLKSCVESVLNSTDYKAVELLIVNNQSVEPATLAYFNDIAQQPSVRVLTYDKPFNYSAINNFAVQEAKGELICLLNNDTEVIRPDWLSQMVGQLSQSDVGIVGARLLFADNRVQHAGDVLGVGGCATHLHFRLPAGEPGYMGRAVVSQDVSAVTAACLLTRRSLYLQVGGLNETDLTVAFNDVDYCLKVREAGWRVIYTPLAVLYHYESVSRGKDDNPIKQRRAQQEADYMRQRWSGLMQGDPFYNPNVNFTAADFRLSAAPRVEKPWKK